jgi:hypothetical protein
MGLTSWLRSRRSLRSPRGREQHQPTAARFRPQLEALEGRDVLSTLTVLNNLDDGSVGSLAYEIGTAQSGDTIVFDRSLSGQTIALQHGELRIDKNLDIEGPGATKLAINGNFTSRVFEVAANVQVTLSGLTIENGDGLAYAYAFDRSDWDYAGGAILNHGTLTVTGCTLSGSRIYPPGGYYWDGGGAIYNDASATLTLRGSTVSGNTADWGGGIRNAGTMTLSGSTVSRNTANDHYGGGIFNCGMATLSGCSVSANIANAPKGSRGQGGGIYNAQGASLTLLDSDVLRNQANDGADLYNLGQLSQDNLSKIGKIGP